MPIRFLRQPIHYSPDDSANPAPGGRSAAATGQPSSPGTGEATPTQPPVKTSQEGSRPGFWGIFLGILDLLVALAPVAPLIMLIDLIGTSGSEGAILSAALVCVTAFLVVLGVIFGLRSLRGKNRSRLWSVLYLVFMTLNFFLLIFFLR